MYRYRIRFFIRFPFDLLQNYQNLKTKSQVQTQNWWWTDISTDQGKIWFSLGWLLSDLTDCFMFWKNGNFHFQPPSVSTLHQLIDFSFKASTFFCFYLLLMWLCNWFWKPEKPRKYSILYPVEWLIYQYLKSWYYFSFKTSANDGCSTDQAGYILHVVHWLRIDYRLKKDYTKYKA